MPAIAAEPLISLDSMPMTAVGKIFKPALRNRATEFALSLSLAEAQIEAYVSATVDPQRGASSQSNPGRQNPAGIRSIPARKVCRCDRL